MSNERQFQQFSIIDLIPKKWVSESMYCKVQIAGYRIAGNLKDLISTKYVDFSFARAVFLYGKLKYWDINKKNVEWTDSGIPCINIDPCDKETNQGLWLLLICPSKQNDYQEYCPVITASSIISTILGRNIVYEKVFENTLELHSGQISLFAPIFSNPLVFPKPDLSDKNIDKLQKAAFLFDKLDFNTRNRVYLALSWYNESLIRDGVNSFIASWIALETLAMPNTSNIRPINEVLSRVYKLSLKDTTERFRVGRLQGMRSRIVHNGELLHIHYLLIEYINALFSDILIDMLEMPIEKFTERILEHPNFDINIIK